MQSIRLVELNDLRNLVTLAFFTLFIYFLIKLINYYVEIISLYLEASRNDQQKTLNEFNDQRDLYESYESSHSNESFDETSYRPSYSDSCCESTSSSQNDEVDEHQTANFKNDLKSQKCHYLTTSDICTISIILLCLPFLPATNLVSYVGFVVAERCLYMPSTGYCLLIATAILQLRQQLLTRLASSTSSLNLKRKQQCNLNNNNLEDYPLQFNRFNEFKNLNANKLKRQQNNHNLNSIFSLFLFTLIICFAYRTYLRNFDWANEETLYRSGINVNPPKALGNLASILSLNGFKQEAEQTYRKALKYRPNMADVHYNLYVLFCILFLFNFLSFLLCT